MEASRQRRGPLTGILVLCLTAGLLTGCWHVYFGSREAGCREGITYIESSYMGAHGRARLDSEHESTCENAHSLVGFAPCDSQTHPVVIYVPGTVQPHDHAFILQLLEALAHQGYAAFSLDYANLWPAHGCNRYRARARCMFDPKLESSAWSTLCALPQADCDRGLAVFGHSQGGLIAILAADFAPQVRWVHAMGVTAHPPAVLKDLDCVLPKNRRLPAEQLLVACGDCDIFFDGTRLNSCTARSPGVSQGLENLTGMRCASQQGCIGLNDSGTRFGWIKIPGSKLRDKEADHCYMFHQGCFGPPDKAWMTDPALPWALPALLDDLKRVFPPKAKTIKE